MSDRSFTPEPIEQVQGRVFLQRPEDQWLWNERDLDSLRQDRYEAQQVRDLYILTSAETAFTDNILAADDNRITAQNYMPQASEEADYWAPAEDMEHTVMSQGEIVEMPQTGDYHDQPRSTLADQLTEMDEWEYIEAPVYQHPHLYVEDDEDDLLPDYVTRDYNRFDALAEALVDGISHTARRLSEEDAQAQQEAIHELAAYHSENLDQPRWQRYLARDVHEALNDASDEYRDQVSDNELFWRSSDRYWAMILQEREHLKEIQSNEQELKNEFARTVILFQRNDPKTADAFLTYSQTVLAVAKTKVRAFDMLSWYAYLPSDVSLALDDLRDHYRSEASSKHHINRCMVSCHGGDFAPDMSDEETFAAIWRGFRFGYETVSVPNGFGNFVMPDEELPSSKKLAFIENSAKARMVRVELAVERLHGRVDSDPHVSDSHIFSLLTR